MGEVRTRMLAGVVLVIVAISILPVGAAASTTGWWYMHGTAANVENWTGLSTAVRMPNAYTVTMVPGVTDGVEIAIPSHFEAAVAVRKIFAEFSTTAPLMQVMAVEVWNGSVLVNVFPGPWSGPNSLTLNLPAKMKFNRGLMLRFIIQNTDQVNQQFLLTTAGAKFVPYP